MKKRKSRGIRVINRRPKIKPPKPDCPHCKKGFMRDGEERDQEAETRVRYRACDQCGAGFDEIGNTWGPVQRRR